MNHKFRAPLGARWNADGAGIHGIGIRIKWWLGIDACEWQNGAVHCALRRLRFRLFLSSFLSSNEWSDYLETKSENTIAGALHRALRRF